MGVPALLKLLDPWLVEVYPGADNPAGTSAGVDASTVIHVLLQRHKARIIANTRRRVARTRAVAAAATGSIVFGALA